VTTGHEETEPIPAALAAEAQAWMAADPDPSTRAELAALLEAGDGAAVRARFERPLSFGTAGLRGALGAGPARMNRLVVRATTSGVAQWVLGQGAEAARRGIVVGRDSRHGSDEFARDVAAVASGAGVAVRVFPRPLPTPITAFAVKHFGAAAGVMVTASHNPAADNGYKVYMADGAQVIPPDDAFIAEAASAAMAGAVASPEISTAAPQAAAAQYGEPIDEVELLGAYRRAAFGLLDPAGPRRLRIVYTPLHGVGGQVLPELLEQAGFGPVSVVAAQGAPDPDFPTVAFPNPEEPGALDLALGDAIRLDADLVLANDPDADRLAIAVPDPVSGAWRMLTGDELGALLADRVLFATSGGDRLVATTIVSSTMLSAMAQAAGVAYVETLTGFKWIARAALRRPGSRFVFGYEEALGYQVGDAVSDKDGLSAALVVAEIAAGAKARGTSVTDRLDSLASRFGVHATAQWSLRLEGPTAQAEMAAIVGRWRRYPPTALAGLAVTELVDLSQGTGELPATDALVLRLAGGARVVLRPSGTEPKLKVYFEVVGGPASLEHLAGERRRADQLLRLLRDDVAARCQSMKGSSASEA
jgi:phosphomannomutase